MDDAWRFSHCLNVRVFVTLPYRSYPRNSNAKLGQSPIPFYTSYAKRSMRLMLMTFDMRKHNSHREHLMLERCTSPHLSPTDGYEKLSKTIQKQLRREDIPQRVTSVFGIGLHAVFLFRVMFANAVGIRKRGSELSGTRCASMFVRFSGKLHAHVPSLWCRRHFRQ